MSTIIKVFAIPQVNERCIDGESDVLGTSSVIDIKGVIDKIVKPHVISHQYKNKGLDGGDVAFSTHGCDIYISKEDRDNLTLASELYGNDEVTQVKFIDCIKDAAAYAMVNCQNIDIVSDYSNTVSQFDSTISNILKSHDYFKEFICRRDNVERFEAVYKGIAYDKIFDLVKFQFKALASEDESLQKDPDLELQVFTTQSYFNVKYADPVFKFHYYNINFDSGSLESFTDSDQIERKRIADKDAKSVEVVLSNELAGFQELYEERKWNSKEVTIKKDETENITAILLYANIEYPTEYFTDSFIKSNFASYLRENYSKNTQVYNPDVPDNHTPDHLEEFLSREWPLLFPTEERNILVMPYVFPFIKSMSDKNISDTGLLGTENSLSKTSNIMPYNRLKNIVDSGKYDHMFIRGVTSHEQSEDNPFQIEIVNHCDIPHPILVSPAITDLAWHWNGSLIPVDGVAVSESERNTNNELHMIISFLYDRVVGNASSATPPEDNDGDSIVDLYSIDGDDNSDSSSFIFRGIIFIFHQTELIKFRDNHPYDYTT